MAAARQRAEALSLEKVRAHEARLKAKEARTGPSKPKVDGREVKEARAGVEKAVKSSALPYR